ncbi:MAG: polysaccharide biosynthesis tyrosine autokinase, partial [Bacteroidota bacterium]
LLSQENILLNQSLQGGQKGMDNEIQILQSSPIMQKVVEELGINISYYRQGRFKEHEFYRDAPISLDTIILTQNRVSFYVRLVDKSSYLLTMEVDDSEGVKGEYGQLVQTPFGQVQLSPTTAERFTPGTYRIQVTPIELVADSYRNELVVERIGSVTASSLLSLKLKDPVPRKAEDIIAKVIEVYNEEEVLDENKVLRSTIEFIDDRLIILADELDDVEGSIEVYRRDNEVFGETAVSSKSFAVGELRAALAEIADLETKKDLLKSLEGLVVNMKDSIRLLPANLVAENPSVATLVTSFNDLVLQWERLISTASSENPTLLALERELQEIRISLLESIQNSQRDLDIPIDRLQTQVQSLERSVLSVPGIEKELLERKRLQGIKENLFLTLLQKREETALSLAVATAGNRIVEPPRSTRRPVYPRKNLVYLASGLLGLFIPILWLFFYQLINQRLSSEDMLKGLTAMPILGRISQHKSKDNVIVQAGGRSAINEMFRQLRTNLHYQSLGQQQQVLAVTSYVSGEGKSFIALNLALTYTLSKKKVVLLELDLRRPMLRRYLNRQDTGLGITNVLVGENTLAEVTQHYAGLDYICGGPIPPNPWEIVGSESMRSILQELKSKYDYIIIDNPPIGMVSDAMLLRQQVNRMLLVVRHNYTKRKMVQHLDEMYRRGELPNAGLVLNGIRGDNGSYYGYGYNSYGQSVYYSE